MSKTIDKMRKVLIALDYDPTAQNVAETGFSIAQSMGAEVFLLHVISEPIHYSSTDYSPILGFTGYIDMSPLELNSVDALKKASENYLENLKQHLGNTNTHTLVKEGDFSESILNAANDLHADLIIMGSHSRRWLENIILGSVTEKVLHHTSVPLLIIPTKKHN